MFLNRKTCLLVYWTLSLYISEITQVIEGRHRRDSIEIYNNAGFYKHKHGKRHQKTITNLKKETDIPVGYQNPYEKNQDIVKDKRVNEGKLRKKDSRLQRSQSKFLRWPKSGMPIFYADNYSPKEECYIKLSIERISAYSCIPIKLFKVAVACAEDGRMENCLLQDPAWTKERILKEFGESTIVDHAVINKEGSEGQGCYSNIGRIGFKQIIHLSSYCFENGMGSVIHEVLHALGYSHEHTRLDRDDYIVIIDENIRYGRSNFEKVNSNDFKDFGPYDFYSLMHYSAYAFSRNTKELPTIRIKNETANVEYSRIGQRVDLTMTDKAKIRSVTRCPGESTYEDHLAAVIKVDQTNTINVEQRSGICKAL